MSISGSTITGNVLSGNFIGTDNSGTLALGNATGVVTNNGATNNTIGGPLSGNSIAFNTGDGVQVEGSSTTGNLISQDLIYGNGGLGIDIGLTNPSCYGNKGQLAPIDLAFTSESLTLQQSTARSRVQSLGRRTPWSFLQVLLPASQISRPEYLGSLVVVIPGSAPPGGTLGGFTASLTKPPSNIFPLQQSGQTVTATITGPGGNTSQFGTPVTQFSQFEVRYTADNVPGEEVGSLRIAILNADNSPTTASPVPTPPFSITFNIPTSDPGYNSTTQTFTISLTTAMPAISVPATIDGTTESQFLGQKAFIAISGSTIPRLANGLDLLPNNTLAGASSITGLEVLGFSGTGILIQSSNNTIGGTVAATGNVIGSADVIGSNHAAGIQITGANIVGNVILGNYIGTDAAGDDLGNSVGVIDNSGGNSIGSTASGAGNTIGFNTTGGVQITGSATSGDVVSGNLIGTDLNGDDLGNAVGIIIGAAGVTVGGTAAGSENIIGFSTSAGVSISGSSATGNLIARNFIGTDAADADLGNPTGIILGSANNIIGGLTAAAANIIGFNSLEGIQITGTGTTGNVVEGNFIGTDVWATLNLGNAVGVQIVNASSNTIGGIVSGAATPLGSIPKMGYWFAPGYRIRLGRTNTSETRPTNRRLLRISSWVRMPITINLHRPDLRLLVQLYVVRILHGQRAARHVDPGISRHLLAHNLPHRRFGSPVPRRHPFRRGSRVRWVQCHDHINTSTNRLCGRWKSRDRRDGDSRSERNVRFLRARPSLESADCHEHG